MRIIKGIEIGKIYETKTKHPEKYVVEEIMSSRLHLGGVKIRYLENNYTKYYDARMLRKGNIRSPFQKAVFGVGYLGTGDNKSSDENGKPTSEYRRWKAVLNRCYNKNNLNKKDSSYDKCTVSDNWLNFQNFATWLKNQKGYYLDWQIDKDLLVANNKIYSEETCCMLPQEINCAIMGKSRICNNNLPCGVTYHKHNNCYIASTGENYLGSYRDVESAWQEVKKFKESLVKSLANKYVDNLSNIAYNSLIEFKAAPY